MARKTELDKTKIEAFVGEFMQHFVGRRAAIAVGVPEKNATSQAAIWLALPQVQAMIATARRDKVERIVLDGDKVIQEMCKVAFSNVRTAVKWGKKGVNLVESDKLTDAQAAAIAEVSETVTMHGGSKRIKMHDKVRALEGLARHLGLFVDKSEVSIRSLPDEIAEARRRVDEARARAKEAGEAGGT